MSTVQYSTVQYRAVPGGRAAPVFTGFAGRPQSVYRPSSTLFAGPQPLIVIQPGSRVPAPVQPGLEN